jgi:hypothetical protein
MIQRFDKLYETFNATGICRGGKVVEVDSQPIEATLPGVQQKIEFNKKMQPGITNLGKWIVQLQDEKLDINLARDVFDFALIDPKIIAGKKMSMVVGVLL